MAKPRRKPSGKWEICLRHPQLPDGRRYFTFDTEAEAAAYGQQWKLLKQSGQQVPAEMLKASGPAPTLAIVVRDWANSGLAAPSQQSPLGSLLKEVGAVKLQDASYTWLQGYVQSLKVKKNLAPSSIRHRVQALGRSIDEYLRHNPKLQFSNPVRLLPKGYSRYSEVDGRLAEDAGGAPRVDVQRDRRLHPGEERRIASALSGWERPDRERGLELRGGDAMLTLFICIVYLGLRLKEGYTLRRGWVDLDRKVMRVQNSKQWRGKVKFREVPIRPEVYDALVAYLSRRALLPNAYLFPFMEEEPDITMRLVSSRLSSRFTTAFAYVGCVDLTEHDLRHEATCRWLEMRDSRGNWMWRMEEINRIMGWSQGSVMAQRYASFRGSDLAERMWATETPAPAAQGARLAALS